MWPFTRRTPDVLKFKLNGIKKITVNGMSFTIRKLNPLLDFPPERMPQIFTEYLSKRPIDYNHVPTQQEILKIQGDMKSIIMAGVLYPALVPIGVGDMKGKENGITVDDLFRDPMMGYKLYMSILSHSLNFFHGLKGLFFSLKIRFWLWMQLRRDMESARQIFFFPTGTNL